jgi:hypothetical protein
VNFKRVVALKVVRGEKTVTRRPCSPNHRSPWWREICGLTVGRQYAICPGRGQFQVGLLVVRSTRRERLGEVDDAEARLEGCADLAEFRALWTRIHGSWDDDQEVWRVEFEVTAVHPEAADLED